MANQETNQETNQDADRQQHDPYARRPGYVTGVDGRTDTWTTAAVAGVVTAVAVLFVSGLLHVTEPFAYPAAVVVGVSVWLVVRARRRAADRRAGRAPDAVAKARSQAVADANGGRRFFVAQNPVVVIVMGGIFVALSIGRLVAVGPSAASILVTVLVAASGAFLGTLVVGHRDRAEKVDGN